MRGPWVARGLRTVGIPLAFPFSLFFFFLFLFPSSPSPPRLRRESAPKVVRCRGECGPPALITPGLIKPFASFQSNKQTSR